jgi:hypothetical protein
MAARWSWQQRLEQLPELVVDEARHHVPPVVSVIGAAMVPGLGFEHGHLHQLRHREPAREPLLRRLR